MFILARSDEAQSASILRRDGMAVPIHLDPTKFDIKCISTLSNSFSQASFVVSAPVYDAPESVTGRTPARNIHRKGLMLGILWLTWFILRLRDEDFDACQLGPLDPHFGESQTTTLRNTTRNNGLP